MGVHPHRRGHRHRHRSLLLRHITADRVCTHPPCAKSARRVYYLAERRRPAVSQARHRTHLIFVRSTHLRKSTGSFIQAARNVAFLLGAKGNENGRGCFPSGVPTEKSFGGVFPPLATRKLLIPPQARYKAISTVRPLVKGGKKGNVNKRINEIGGKTYEKSEQAFTKEVVRRASVRKRVRWGECFCN